MGTRDHAWRFVLAEIGRRLKELYSAHRREPLPDRLRGLLDELFEQSPSGAQQVGHTQDERADDH